MPPDPAPTPATGRRLTAELLAAGLNVRVRVTGTSMTPRLCAGDEVEIVPLRGAPRIGDVVFARTSTGFVLHRVVHLPGPDLVQTRGDANWRLDDAVARRNVLGRAARIRRAGTARWRALPGRPLAWLTARRCLALSWLAYRANRGAAAIRRAMHGSSAPPRRSS